MVISKSRLAGISACLLLIWAVFASTPLDVPSAAAQELTPDTTPPRLALPGSVCYYEQVRLPGRGPQTIICLGRLPRTCS